MHLQAVISNSAAGPTNTVSLLSNLPVLSAESKMFLVVKGKLTGGKSSTLQINFQADSGYLFAPDSMRVASPSSPLYQAGAAAGAGSSVFLGFSGVLTLPPGGQWGPQVPAGVTVTATTADGSLVTDFVIALYAIAADSGYISPPPFAPVGLPPVGSWYHNTSDAVTGSMQVALNGSTFATGLALIAVAHLDGTITLTPPSGFTGELHSTGLEVQDDYFLSAFPQGAVTGTFSSGDVYAVAGIVLVDGHVTIGPGGGADSGTVGCTTPNFVFGQAVDLGTGADGACVFDGVNPVPQTTRAGSIYTSTGVLNASSITVNAGIEWRHANWDYKCTGPVDIYGWAHNNGTAGSNGQDGGNPFIPFGGTGGPGGNNTTNPSSPGSLYGAPPGTASPGGTGGSGHTGCTNGDVGAASGAPSSGTGGTGGRGGDSNPATGCGAVGGVGGAGVNGGGGGGGGGACHNFFNDSGGGGGGAGAGGYGGKVKGTGTTITVHPGGKLESKGGDGGNGGHGSGSSSINAGVGGGGAPGCGGAGGDIQLGYTVAFHNYGSISVCGGQPGIPGTHGISGDTANATDGSPAQPGANGTLNLIAGFGALLTPAIINLTAGPIGAQSIDNSQAMLLMPAFNAGDRRAQKRFGDLFVEAQVPLGASINVNLWSSQYQSPVVGYAPTSLTPASGGLRAPYVLDFASGNGFYSTDLEAVISWPLGTTASLFTWQPTVIEQPESIQNRPSDWDEAGTKMAKFVQGLVLEADTFGQAKTFAVQRSDDAALFTPTEVPAIFNGQRIIPFSFPAPFIAHSMRLHSTDNVPWRVYGVRWVFQPYPESLVQWQTEMLSFGPGWQSIYYVNLPHISTADLVLTLVFDQGPVPSLTLTVPNSGGLQTKTKVTVGMNKFKLVSFRVASTAPATVFAKDLEVWVKAWGSSGPFTPVRPFGGASNEGAEV